jgi:outer membrane murein-binding lipoprotein Lpp
MQVQTLGVVINAIVMAGVGLALWWAFRGRFDAMDARIDRLDKRTDRLETSVDGLRSDLTAVALAVGARPRTQGH